MRGLWGQVMDVTHRLYQRKRFHKRRVLTLLRELRRMTSAMPDGAILLGPSREILWFNRTAGQWLGLRRKLDYGLRIDNLIRLPEFVNYVLSGGVGRGPRLTMPKLGDRTFAFNLVTTNEWGLQLMIVRDVTTEARLENMRRDFVANASHELRSPLTVVSGYLDTLADDPTLDAQWREPVKEMQRQSDRMRSIVQDLLELSRLEAGNGEAEQTPVDVGGMLALIRKEVLARPEHPAEFNLRLDSDAFVLGAESELHSVLQNLISNAAKYTPADGRIDVRYWVDGKGAHVAVADTGIGIPAGHIPRLTERFYRVDAGRSRKLGGSGLGLAIAKHALQRHGAQLEIESEEGKGSIFTCHFPPARVETRVPGPDDAQPA
jgi:two-component system phosphate regulon sensor histidine kinase PhoR